MITLENIDKYLLFKAIVGSQAYGLNTPESDIDIKGVFLLPNDYLLTNEYIPQISDDSNNITYYELNRFMELIKENNPNIIELLFSNDNMIQYCHPLFKSNVLVNKESFLTKKLQHTFGGYAISQIKKARGLNKKIVNPIEKEKKTPLDFCHIFDKETGYMMLANQWLRKMGYDQKNIGLAQMPNGVELYKIYYGENFKGIIKDNSNSIRHSEIPKNYQLEGFLTYNKNGYVCYCKEYKEYWEWVEHRNPVRYNDNISHNQNYDGKNMLHCNRLLDMAIEIGCGDGVNLIRPDRDWLLSVKKGLISYDEIMKKIKEKSDRLVEVYTKTDLPDDIDNNTIKEVILNIRKKIG
jgi:predicted nucleotidyltransferase